MKVRVINTKTSSPVEVEVSNEVATWEGLKETLSDIPQFSDLDFGKCHVYAKDATGRKSLVLGTDSIPTGDFKLFVTPIQTKGGMYNTSTLKDLKTKLNTVIDELLGLVPASEVAQPEVDPNALTDDELDEINSIDLD